MDERCNGIKRGKKNGKDDPKEKHEKVVDEDVDILVCVAHHFVVDWKCPSALVLMKAFLEVKLQ